MRPVISKSIQYVGVDDPTIDLFESQYVVPHGVSYNSYVILDDRIAIMDTVDRRATAAWLEQVQQVLGDRTPDYLIISHMEPDHAARTVSFHAASHQCQGVPDAVQFL